MRRCFAALALLLAINVANADHWRFILIGDTPYSDYERHVFPRMMDDINDEGADFVIHVGDIKYGNARCDNEIFLDRLGLFNASTAPFIFLPGDNDWTDCRRLSAGHFNEAERLAKLREIFFPSPHSLGKRRLPLERQSADLPEHLRWRHGPLLFLTLNVPGPDNNYGLRQEPSSEFVARNPAVLDWLKQGFALARKEKRAGIVIAMQANPGFKEYAQGVPIGGFRELLDTLRDETLNFPGQVLLLHGDTHWQRVDKPFHVPGSSKRIENFTRAESFGYPYLGWVKVTIDDKDPGLFSFETNDYPKRRPFH